MRSRNMSKAGILLSLTLVACASAPGYRAPEVQAPTAFRETRDTVIETLVTGRTSPDTLVWPDLGDTTLTRLLKEAIGGGNLDVRAAEARVRGARAARTEAVLDFAPTVTFAGGYTRQRLSNASFPGFGTFPDQDIWDGGFDAFWELDLFGRVRRNVQAQGAFVAL